MQSSRGPEVRWDRMTAPALVDAARENAVVIIPLGATEQHGPHLPTQVDWRLAYEVSLAAARRMQSVQRALVTPAIPFGPRRNDHAELRGDGGSGRLRGALGGPPWVQAHICIERARWQHRGA